MRKHFLFVVRALLVLLIVIGFTSCNNNTEKLIVGKWKIVSLFVDGEDSRIPTYNVICTFKKDGNCTGCIDSMFLDGRYLIDDSELKITDLYGEGEVFEDEKYAIRLNIGKLTKKTLNVNGTFMVYERNTMKPTDGYTTKPLWT